MPRFLSSVVIISLLAAVSYAAETTDEQLVQQAVLALPAHLRDGAAVVRFENGKRHVLRAGDNGLICQPDDPDLPGIAIWCYPKSHAAYARRWYQLAAEGRERAEVDSMVTAEIESGELEWPNAAVNYNLRGGSLDNALSLTVVYVPYATGASIGITEERDFHRPWLMLAGTAFAHIMIPGQ